MSTQGLDAPPSTRTRPIGPIVFRKTEAGHAELQQRAASSSALRLRWALVMIDGRTPAGQMIERLGSIGIDEAMFVQLELLGFIEPAPLGALAGTPCAPPAGQPSAAGRAEPGAGDGQGRASGATSAPGGATRAASTVAEPTATDPETTRRLAELEAFFAGTIRDLIGLRGLMLQLAAERAATLDDYRALRDRYLAAVAKAKGALLAEALGARLDILLR